LRRLHPSYQMSTPLSMVNRFDPSSTNDTDSSPLNEMPLFSHPGYITTPASHASHQSPGPYNSNDVWRRASDLPRIIHDAGTDATCLMHAQRSRPDVAEYVSVL
jgi:hypothetical protein